ncbi:MAG: hypothetical protein GXP54_00500 [Deltaproteobacteria bacterium]|nr:hypothetical protein [Deltaproteobacteria bacterium]
MMKVPTVGAVACTVGLALLFSSAGALAQRTTFDKTVPMVDRPITLKKGHAEFGMDLVVGLDKGAAGDHVALASGYLSDRYDGVSISYGVSDRFEIGAALEMLWWDRGHGLDILGSVYVFAKWAFLENLGVEVGLQLPSKAGEMGRLVVHRGSILLSAPFKYPIVPGVMAIHARPDVWVGFAKTGYYGVDSSPQITVFADLGLTFNITPELFLDVSVGVGKPVQGYTNAGGLKDGVLFLAQGLKSRGTDMFLPASVWLGYTVIPSLDIGLSFTFQDLNGHGIDNRNLTITSAFRF